MQKKRKRDTADEGPSRSPDKARSNGCLEESDTELKNKVSRITQGFYKDIYPSNIQEDVAIKFEDEDKMITQLKKALKTTDCIFFHACYDLRADLLMSDREHVSATAHEIWKATGYRFR